jgi:hypothetical protein
MRLVKTLCGAAALVALLAPGARADEWNKRTYLTFSGPVQIPGATLPAGTYTFEIADPDSSRHVIRVSEKDTNKPLGLFMTIPNERMEAPSDNLIMFSERPRGAPQAIQVWFYPGDKIGEEFVYPRTQAVSIAKANKKPVLATADASSKQSEKDRMAAMKSAKVGRVDENGRMTDESKSSTTTAETTTAAPANTIDGSRRTRTETTTAKADTTPKATTARSNTVGTTGSRDNARRELPRTASNLVLIELLSGLALIGGVTTRRLRQRAEAR